VIISSGAGKYADLHLGEAHFRARHRDAVMTGERGFEPAAQRIAMDRRDDWLRALVRDVIVAAGRRRGRRAPAELADVGAGDKAPARADQDHRLHRRIGVALVDRRRDALRHARRQGIHRRVVDGDDADIAVFLEFHQFALALSHFSPPKKIHQ
jgi:hypothetical protein